MFEPYWDQSISIEEAIQLTCGVSVILLECPSMSEKVPGEASGVFLHNINLESRYLTVGVCATLKTHKTVVCKDTPLI